jgi:uncharacterized protein YggE
MKRIVAIISVSIWTALAYGSPLPDFPFIFAEGEAETNVAPDKAIMTFTIKSFDKNSSNAVSIVHARSYTVIKFLEEKGITSEFIVSYELDKEDVRRTENYQELEIVGYEVTRNFKITINDLSQYAVIGKTLFETDNVVHIDPTFGRHDQKEIEKQLLTAACSNAKQNAEAMAHGFGQELGDIYCISKRDFGSLYAEFGFDDSSPVMYGSSQGLDKFNLLIPSTIAFHSRVKTLFKLK